MGFVLSRLERAFNVPEWPDEIRRLSGALALLLLLGLWGGLAFVLARFLSYGWLGALAIVLLAASLPAQRSLYEHVAAVAEALETQGLDAARQSVGMIVGRDTGVLDEAGIARASVESLAENFSDGVVAPALWIALLGLPGGVLYKAANTADSMIGHRTDRYAFFGWAAARFDDLVNLPASRLSVLWIVAGAMILRDDARGALRAVTRDASHHRSPNAGWPEAAMAGALGFKLAGPRAYDGRVVDDVFMGEGRRDLGAADIRRALRLYRAACAIQWAAIALVALILQA